MTSQHTTLTGTAQMLNRKNQPTGASPRLPNEPDASAFRLIHSRLRLLLILTIAATSQTSPGRADGPHWIWTKSPDDASAFSQNFTIDEPVQAATIKLAADFCRAAVLINGRPALTVEPYTPTQELDVANYLQRGENEIVVSAESVAGPAAVALSLLLVGKDGKPTTIVTDDAWLGATSLGPVRPELWGLGRRSAVVSPFDNYEQWQQRKGDAPARKTKFWTVPGFEITQLREAAADEGSWIALAFDDAGRAVISREDQGLLRMTLDDGRSTVAQVEPIDVDLKECRGLLFLDGTLYANANGSKSMVRLRLTEDGKAEDVELLREFPGDPGHGRNDLALGPDGDIYSIHGDGVQAPGEPLVDRTSPLREGRRGKTLKEGYLVHTDRDGKHWEMPCVGLRNPYGIAFHPNGDLFTYDADNEFDMGTPWYRPTRIVQLVGGGEYGWHVAKGTWPVYVPDHPDNSPPVINVGRGSPTACMFGTNLKFPAPYREALFFLDWAYGRVVAVHLAPRGAGYRAALELFLQGQPLNVTDLAAGPDGAMYLITGGRKTQSALYRVAFTGTAESPAAESKHEQDCAAFAEQQRAVRKKLEAFHGVAVPEAVEAVRPYLTDADPMLRHAARVALEQQPLEILKAEDSSLTLIRTENVELVSSIANRLPYFAAADLDLNSTFVVTYLYQRCLELVPTVLEPHLPEILLDLAEMWPDAELDGRRVGPYGDDAELRRRLAMLLADLGDPDIVERVTTTLLASAVQEDRLQGLLALRKVREGWTPDTRRVYFAAIRDAARFVGGQGMPSFLDKIRTEALATLTDAEQAEMAELLKPATVEDEPLPPARPKVRTWTLGELTSVHGPDAKPGDAARGATIFRDALCNRCHRAGLAGPAVGPDLTFVARRFSKRDILESVLTPSLAVAEQYRNVQVVTESGQVHTGRVVAEGDFRSEKLKLNTDPLRPGQVVELDKKEIAESRVLDASPMPQGLLDSFNEQEIADLLAFLEARESGPTAR